MRLEANERNNRLRKKIIAIGDVMYSPLQIVVTADRKYFGPFTNKYFANYIGIKDRILSVR